VIVFTSHHGEEFYEHGRIDHGMTLFDEVIRIPLIVVVPGAAKGKRIDSQVRNIDILPTILAVVGITPPSEVIDGVSLVPLMQGDAMKLNAISETSYRYATFQTALRSWDGWKLIYDREQQIKKLYHYVVDATEQHDQYGQRKAEEQPLINTLLQYINGTTKQR
jgi:arylsulfatase A-like enzyme